MLPLAQSGLERYLVTVEVASSNLVRHQNSVQSALNNSEGIFCVYHHYMYGFAKDNLKRRSNNQSQAKGVLPERRPNRCELHKKPLNCESTFFLFSLGVVGQVVCPRHCKCLASAVYVRFISAPLFI